MSPLGPAPGTGPTGWLFLARLCATAGSRPQPFSRSRTEEAANAATPVATGGAGRMQHAGRNPAEILSPGRTENPRTSVRFRSGPLTTSLYPRETNCR